MFWIEEAPSPFGFEQYQDIAIIGKNRVLTAVNITPLGLFDAFAVANLRS